ncbi:hypothetical protein [Tellurirhabdus bombi]|uniref:hypothetical protein n=1 Tax=Tellurirhabdus bombi TaxID=2907205 RepID=UPI001F20601B|nr:hypothetical protein [Tellurirhabdus bombi]
MIWLKTIPRPVLYLACLILLAGLIWASVLNFQLDSKLEVQRGVVATQKEELAAQQDTIAALRADLRGRDQTIANTKAQLDLAKKNEIIVEELRKKSATLSASELAIETTRLLARLRQLDKK